MGERAPANRREAILAAAARLMVEHGYDGTPVSAIGAELGISKAAITYYFPSKESLIVTLLDPYLSDLEREVPETDGSSWPDDARAACDSYLRVLTRHRPLALWLDRDLALDKVDEVQRRRTAIVERVLAAITGSSADPADLARGLAVLGGLLRPLRELDADVLAEHHDLIVEAALVSYGPIETS